MIFLLCLFSSMTTFSSHFEIHGKPTLFRAGSLQWYRIPKSEWRDRLDKFKAIGYNMIEMYVSWQYIEPIQGHFKLEDLQLFLKLAKEYHLYVYFRPGPYICNEENSGGYPAWVIAKSSKSANPNTPDGLYGLRTNDYDYLEIVRSYFEAINKIAKQYLITNGGTIVLYQIENEYDYFEQSIEADKVIVYNGKRERALNFKLDTYDMFNKLKQVVISQGIDIPLTTCPGTVESKGMGGIEEIIPLPNYYASPAVVEQQSLKYKQFQSNSNLYKNYPSGISETYRSASVLSRMFISGMDLVSNFNSFGMFQYGHHNNMLPQFPGFSGFKDIPVALKAIFKFKDIKDIASGFVRPPLALSSSVVDYVGAVSPSGQIRDKFHNLRRLNVFYDSFEHIIAPVDLPRRSLSGSHNNHKMDLFSDSVNIANRQVGSKDSDGKGNRVIYWLPISESTFLIGLLNDGSMDQITMGINSVSVSNFTFPTRDHFVIPREEENAPDFAQGGRNGTADKYYLFHLVINWPLKSSIVLQYSTAEVLLLDSLEDKSVLVLHNVEGTPCEFKLQGATSSIKNSDILVESDNVIVYCRIPEAHESPLIYKFNTNNHELTVMVVGRHMSGRTWHIGNLEYLVGPDYYNERTKTLSFISDNQFFYFYGVTKLLDYKVVNRSHMITKYGLPTNTIELPLVDFSNLMAEIVLDDYNKIAGYINKTGPLGSAESMGYYDDYIQYKSTFKLSSLGSVSLVIDSVSDFGTVFINGHYIAALCPLGTKIDSNSWNHRYAFKIPASALVEGDNVLHIRVDIWGRGNFMFPRGNLGHIPVGKHLIPTGIHIKVPVAGFDSVKGVIGNGYINNKKIEKWQVKNGNLYNTRTLPISMNMQTLPIRLEPGQLKWATFTMKKTKKNNAARIPNSLKLKGKNLKINIYINHVLIGKWISDEGILNRGNYYSVDRQGWTKVKVDHFPVEEYSDNFKIVLQMDSKGHGILENMTLGLAEEIVLENGDFAGQYERKYYL
eukprot:NODE_21_length_38511_cov_0.503306.p3 type:complete len:1005 gc:universal NODE_21_length_38511_cov_0.503306:18918-15904(-)